MDIKSFVKASIIEICEGISDAQKHLTENKIGGSVNNTDHQTSPSRDIEFDVAVSITQTDKNEGSGKIHIASILAVGGGLETSTANNVVSRLKFVVPVSYPVYVGPRTQMDDPYFEYT